MKRGRILVADDDESLRRVTQMQLEELGYEVFAAADGTKALEMLAEAKPALVITDLRMPGISGLDVLRQIRTGYPETTVVLITAFATVEGAVEAMKAGAYDYITKPIDYEQLRVVVSRAMERQNLVQEVRNLRVALDEKYGFDNIIGKSKVLLRVLSMASRAAQSNSTVLIRGETGTGKELLAKAIHHNCPRSAQSFVTINCGAIPKDLLESELFGHHKGSFTGALANKRGRVEIADGGTLFLDEIGELPLELQVKLLRLIQDGQIDKVGSLAPDVVDVRVIAATHRNLQAMIEDGMFREDLYYRLAVIPLELPPLRERADDIPELVQMLFIRAARKHGKTNLKLPPALLPYFSGYRWPGNVRELENIIERLVVLTVGDEIALEDLPDFLRERHVDPGGLRLTLPEQGMSLEGVERELILKALEKFNWNQTHAARYLDLSRRTLIYRMEKYGLQKEQPTATE
jgi:two-component system NtrC family response regulator